MVHFRQGRLIRYVVNPYTGKGNNTTVQLIYQPSENINTSLTVNYADFYKLSDNSRDFNYTIIRSKNTYQLNKYLFFRAIFEYNTFNKDLSTDFLASFTYIPGTVIHIGYGSLYEKVEWDGMNYIESDNFLETKKGLFFKASYLWRL